MREGEEAAYPLLDPRSEKDLSVGSGGRDLGLCPGTCTRDQLRFWGDTKGTEQHPSDGRAPHERTVKLPWSPTAPSPQQGLGLPRLPWLAEAWLGLQGSGHWPLTVPADATSSGHGADSTGPRQHPASHYPQLVPWPRHSALLVQPS